jgi:hypothetical protein
MRSRYNSGLRAKWLGFSSWWGQDFSLFHSVQTNSGAHPASYPVGLGGSFPGEKAAETWRWPLTSIYCRGQEWLSYTFTPWYRDNFTVLYFTSPPPTHCSTVAPTSTWSHPQIILDILKACAILCCNVR